MKLHSGFSSFTGKICRQEIERERVSYCTSQRWLSTSVAYTVILNVHKGIFFWWMGCKTTYLKQWMWLMNPICTAQKLDLFSKMLKDLSTRYLEVVLQFLGRFVWVQQVVLQIKLSEKMSFSFVTRNTGQFDKSSKHEVKENAPCRGPSSSEIPSAGSI